MAAATRAKGKEFGLSDEVPMAVLETQLTAARDAWERRSADAAARVKFPAAPYRIKGDTDAGEWIIEEAVLQRSSRPSLGYRLAWFVGLARLDESMTTARVAAAHKQDIAELNADRPTAKLVWKRIGPAGGEYGDPEGFMTYRSAHQWLLDYLEPVRDESTYFTAAGHVSAAHA